MGMYLIITIDTEEEFDWHADFSRHDHSVDNIFSHHDIMHDVYGQYAISPIYLISYPVLNHPDCVKLLRQIALDKQAILGTQLHPWVTPPFDEELSIRHSYACHLPNDLEWQKLKCLTEKFKSVFGFSPLHYKAGRYGFGEKTSDILHELGYLYNFSYYTGRYADLAHKGFDHRHMQAFPFDDNNQVKHFPVMGAYHGGCADIDFMQRWFQKSPILRRILRRLGMIDFGNLTPENTDLKEMIAVTQTALRQGHDVFHMTYHSSVFLENKAPLYKNKQEIMVFKKTLADYFAYIQGQGGMPFIFEAS